MRWFQPIECDKTVKKPLVCDYSNFEEYNFDEDEFKIGKEIINWQSDIIFEASQKKYDGIPDDALQNAYMIPVYSKKLIDELLEAGIEGIQYLPIRVLNYKGEVQNTFCIANILNYIEALDLSKSNYNRFGEDFPNPNVRGVIAGVTKFVLLKEKLKGFDIIRLKEYNLSFFVSERFVEIFEKNNFTGYSFQEVELF
ncbi:MAG: DUF1629 domain-containing protein [Clostridiaceae bacterium]